MTPITVYFRYCSYVDYGLETICYFHLFAKCNFYVSQFTVETYCFTDGRCLFKQPQSVLYHWNQYDEEISKKCRSVRPSVCPFVTLTKKAHSSFIIDSRKIIRISDERVWHSLQENVAIFSKYYFSKILDRIFQKLGTCIKIHASLSLLIVE